MHLFFVPDIDSGDLHSLSEEESNHCTRVLRLGKGDLLHLTNGRGTLYEATIMDEKARKLKVRINRTWTDWGKRSYRLHIGLAPTKNMSRFEWFLEKATEIGIDEITPILCEHSERRSLPKERLHKILVAALKQSQTTWLPLLHEPVSFAGFIHQSTTDLKYIAHYDERNPQLKAIYKTGTNARILIGPEGDFSPGEIRDAQQSGYRLVNLGNSRLRTETAGIMACSVISTINA